MKNKLSCKILAVEIIVLLICVGIHPAFAVNVKQSMVNMVSADDCGYNEIDNRQLVILKKQLNRLEVYTKLLLLLSKYNPEFKDEVQELSNEILTIIEMYDKLETCLYNSDKPICDVLYNAYFITIDFLDVLDELYDKFKDFKIFIQILEVIYNLIGVYGVIFVIIGLLFNCEWADEWPWPP